MMAAELAFDANFESGNLSSVERVDDTEYNVFIKPDYNLKVRFWFYFRVANVTPKVPYIFHILSFSKAKTTFSSCQTPLVRSTSRNKWERIPKQQCFYYISSKHKCYTSNAIVSFIFVFDKVEDYFFAFSYPFTYSMLTKFNTRLVDHKLSFLQLVELGKTFNGNSFPVLLISQDIDRVLAAASSAKSQVPAQLQRKRIIWVSARVHPGEVPSSYILHGLLEFLISNNPTAKFLRGNTIFLLIPMINIDGVISGFYRGSAVGVDLNRTYYAPDSKQHPETYMLRALFYELVVHGNMRPYQCLANESRTQDAGANSASSGSNSSNGLDQDSMSDELDLSSVSPQKLSTVFDKSPLNRILLRKSIVLETYNNQVEHVLDGGAGIQVTNSVSNSTDRLTEYNGDTSETSYDTDIRSISRTSSCSNYSLGCSDQLLGKTELPIIDTGEFPPIGKLRGAATKVPSAPPAKPSAHVQFPEVLTNLFGLNLNLDFVIDLHSHSNISGGFLFVNPDAYVFNKLKRTSCELVFPLMLAQNCATFGALNKSFKNSKDRREGSLRRAFMNLGKSYAFDNAPYVYCLEVSNSHGPDPVKSGKIQQVQMIGNGAANENAESDDLSASMDLDEKDRSLYTPSSWMKIGEKLCQTLYDLYYVEGESAK